MPARVQTPRPLPDFAVIGALRAGTTTLHSLLSQVSGICVSRIKETDFFIAELNYGRGSDWYASLFPRPDLVCGDVSPNYSTDDRFPGVAERLKAHAPHARIVYVVRDPVERARSHYQHTWLKGAPLEPPERFGETAEGAHIIGASMYHRQLVPYVEAFGREAIMVLDFESLRTDPRGALRRVAAFVGCPIEESALGAINTDPKNASMDLATLPSWWINARRTMETSMPRLVSTLRHHAPDGMLSSVRRAVSQTAGERRPPSFSEEVRHQLADRLSEDAARFRTLVGERFAGWSV